MVDTEQIWLCESKWTVQLMTPSPSQVANSMLPANEKRSLCQACHTYLLKNQASQELNILWMSDEQRGNRTKRLPSLNKCFPLLLHFHTVASGEQRWLCWLTMAHCTQICCTKCPRLRKVVLDWNWAQNSELQYKSLQDYGGGHLYQPFQLWIFYSQMLPLESFAEHLCKLWLALYFRSSCVEH